MNAEQLTAIKERTEKATLGPWDVQDDLFVIEGDGLIIGDLIAKTESANDAIFIAHAYGDIPALIAEVERLRYENNALKRSLEYIAPRKINPDWSIAHNALAVWGKSE